MNTHRARKRFGQHFLSDPGSIDAILKAIRPQRDDVIVEIGPGRGALTDSLARDCGELHLVELDRDLVTALEKRFADSSRVTVHSGDALAFDFTRLGTQLRIVGNLPYNISTPLLFHLLDQRHAIADMHFMLQKEVVERMAAVPGSKAYGRLSVMLGCFLQVEPLFDVEPDAFEPPPAVMSAVARLTPLADHAADVHDFEALSRLVATAFSQRRKTLRNSLKKVVDTVTLEELGIDPGLRPEQIGIADYVALSNHLGRALR